MAIHGAVTVLDESDFAPILPISSQNVGRESLTNSTPRTLPVGVLRAPISRRGIRSTGRSASELRWTATGILGFIGHPVPPFVINGAGH